MYGPVRSLIGGMIQVVLLIGAFFASSLSAGGSWRDQHPQQRQLSYSKSALMLADSLTTARNKLAYV